MKARRFDSMALTFIQPLSFYVSAGCRGAKKTRLSKTTLQTTITSIPILRSRQTISSLTRLSVITRWMLWMSPIRDRLSCVRTWWRLQSPTLPWLLESSARLVALLARPAWMVPSPDPGHLRREKSDRHVDLSSCAPPAIASSSDSSSCSIATRSRAPLSR